MRTRRSFLKHMTVGCAASGVVLTPGSRDAVAAERRNSCNTLMRDVDILGQGPAVICSHGFMMDRSMFSSAACGAGRQLQNDRL